MSNAVSVNKIIGVWLKREYHPEDWGNFHTRLPTNITLEEMDRVVENQDYSNQRDNTIRFLALDYSRIHIVLAYKKGDADTK